MHTAAGIDTLLFDQTNSLVYRDEMLAVCENLEQGRLQGSHDHKPSSIDPLLESIALVRRLVEHCRADTSGGHFERDPYILEHGNPKPVIRHPQADSLGDRGEWDEDFSGGGKLYLAPWDGKIHLLGAEKGVWTVDKNRQYWGAAHPNKSSSTEAAQHVEEVVQYEDTNHNGFFDRVTYDYDGDRVPDLTADLLELGLSDECEVVNPAALGWNGLRKKFSDLAQDQWVVSMRMYRTAFRLGFADAEMAEFTLATGTHEKYESAARLRQEILRRVLSVTPESLSNRVLQAAFGNDLETLFSLMETIASLRSDSSPAR